MSYLAFRYTISVIASIGLYSVLYRENKFYRFWEHVFLGMAAGWALFTLWAETLYPTWWNKMVGSTPTEGGGEGSPGYYLWALVAPIGFAGYLVFSKKHAWIARIPVGIIIGLWSGQQFNAWINRFWPQINASMVPIFPTTWSPLTRPSGELSPEVAAEVARNVYFTQAIGNLIATITLLSVLAYFLFSFELKSKFMQNTTKLGRYLLMIGFGAIFGSTVMMRFSLLIDRMYFITVEWFNEVAKRGVWWM